MIIFHEGLPRSGKSYEAMAKHVIPTLQKGRHVYAHIDGLDADKIALAASLPVGIVNVLLHTLTKDQVKEIYKHVTKDSLVVIDEAQDHWPTTRQPLDEHMTTFVTQHGHEGLDIILMGQDHRDVHTLWRRRIQNMITFLKLDAVGMENRYKWTMHRYDGKKFVPVTSGIEPYDAKYFGTYASHTAGTENKGNYQDKRAVIWNRPGLKYGIPVALLIGAWAIDSLWSFFHPAQLEKSTPAIAGTQKPVNQVVSSSISSSGSVTQSVPAVQAPPPEPPLEAETRYVLDLQKQGRLRLAGTIVRASGEVTGIVEVLDGSFHRREVMTFAQLASMGWQVSKTEYGVRIEREKQAIIVTSWPVDPFGQVNKGTLNDGSLEARPTA